ncbi:MAG: tetratricopeptide repeat protein [Cytophagales bacterium]|nr:MAG: tetratricopeptide repeat protein [Cytophagales bacterium]
MQTFSHFFFIFFILVFSFFDVSLAQSSDKQVSMADSLFSQRRYLEALRSYERLYQQDKKQITSHTLLKMAFIYEGLKDYTNALYYLNEYYLQRPQNDILKKMENIALEYRLKGYEYSDFAVLQHFYKRYFSFFLFGFCGFTILLFVFMLFRNRHRGYWPNRYGVVFLSIIIVFAYFVNFVRDDQRGIVVQNYVYLMQEPSAGASVEVIVNKGHRLRVLGESDIWYRVVWEEKTVYIRKHQLRLLE